MECRVALGNSSALTKQTSERLYTAKLRMAQVKTTASSAGEAEGERDDEGFVSSVSFGIGLSVNESCARSVIYPWKLQKNVRHPDIP